MLQFSRCSDAEQSRLALAFFFGAITTFAVTIAGWSLYATAFSGPSAAAGTGGGAVTTDSSGNLALGTSTNPSYKLLVNGKVMSATGGFVFPDGTTQTTAAVAASSSQWTTSSTSIYYSGGNVGIGTSNPGALFEIYNGGADTILKLSRGATTSTIIRVGTDGALVFANQGTDLVTLKSGNVGIATTSPAYTLDVNGTARFTSSTYASAYYYTSDVRLKENIHQAPGLDAVSQLNGVTFNWKLNGSPGMGLIAQDVAKVFPAAVAHDQDGIESVNYGALTGPIVEAIKGLKRDEDELRENLAAKDARISELEHEVRALSQSHER